MDRKDDYPGILVATYVIRYCLSYIMHTININWNLFRSVGGIATV